MLFEGRNVPCKQYYASGLRQHIIICTDHVTAARRTLQTLHICYRDTIASSSSSKLERVPTDCYFYSLPAASICCHRGRHRCNAVVHACLQPTRGRCLKANLNFCVRPSGGRLRIATNFFLITSSSVFPNFLTNCSFESACSEKK